MKKSNRVIVNGRNYFNQKSFTEMCEVLEAGQVLEVFIDCIGHSRNNYEQENYRKALQQKYYDTLETEILQGNWSYSYIYRLKGVPHETPSI